MSTSTTTSAVLYSYQGKYGVTREGAVLAAEPFSARASSVTLARLVFVTDDGHGRMEAINALGFALEPGIPEEQLPICRALLIGRYATAVHLAERLGLLK